MKMEPIERDFILGNAVHSIISVYALFSGRFQKEYGYTNAQIMAASALGHIALMFFLSNKYPLLQNIWRFTLSLSVLQIYPNWVLCTVLETIKFRDDGFFKIGAVPAYMAGLWVIPFTLIVFAGIQTERRTGSHFSAYLMVILSTLIIFGISEMTFHQYSWYATNVWMINHAAVYVIPAEIFLGITTYLGWKLVKEHRFPYALFVAFWVMLSYTGALAFCYLLVEMV